MPRCVVWVARNAELQARRISPRMFDRELAQAIEMIEAHRRIGRSNTLTSS